MYFAILGKHITISLCELATVVQPSYISENYKRNIVSFDANKKNHREKLAGSIKSGRVVSEEKLLEELNGEVLLGIADIKTAKSLKKNIASIKRFKEVPLTHTDIDVKKKGIEIIALPEQQWGIVENYQDISLYEAIDFGKPSSGMTIGMMPAKLAHILVNIAVGTLHTEKNTVTVRDPFCGFGTTNFIANALGYNTIGSDIKIAEAKRNLKRRLTEDQHFSANNKATFFRHDVTETFKKPFLRHADVIVSEGRLGPTVSMKTREPELINNIQRISTLYKNFFRNIKTLLQDTHALQKIVITLPEYLKFNGEQVQDVITPFLMENFPNHSFIEETYARKGQKVGRKILVITID